MAPVQESSKLLKFLNIAFIVFCVVGFVIQVLNVSFYYFLFQTVPRVHQGVSDAIIAPNLVLCFKIEDVIDSELLNHSKKQGTNLREDVTIAQVLSKTPRARLLLDTVFYRTNSNFTLMKAVSHNSSLLFKVRKYVIQDLVCYRLLRMKQLYLKTQRLHYALHFPGIIYDFILHKRFNDVHKIRVMVTHGEEYPYLSHVFSPTLDRKSGVAGSDCSVFSYAHSMFHLLPKPWDTACGHRGLFNHSACGECHQRFLNLVTNKPKVAFSVVLTNPSNATMISKSDLKNRMIDQALVNSTKACEHLCRISPCLLDYTMTMQRLCVTGKKNKFARIRITAPSKPLTLVFTERKISIQEYGMYVSSCLGLWFGLSLTTVSPFLRMYRKLKSKRRKRRRNPKEALIQRLAFGY